MKFIIACQDHQAEKSAATRLYQGRKKTAQVGFEPRLCRSQSRQSNPSATLP